MDKFRIVLSPKAGKDLDGFGDSICSKISSSVKALEENPFPRGKMIKKLKGRGPDFYRLRADKHRIFYMIASNEAVILRILSKKDAERFIRQL